MLCIPLIHQHTESHTEIINAERLIPKLAHEPHYPLLHGMLMWLYWNFSLWLHFKQKFTSVALGRSLDWKILWLIPTFCVFFSFHLACISTLRWGWAKTKRISIIPVYPRTVFFNISGMSAFVYFALCYSKNARFAISSLGWAPGQSGMSKGSPPRQHPSRTQSSPQPWAEEPGDGSQQTTHSARIFAENFTNYDHFSFLQDYSKPCSENLSPCQWFPAVAQ